MVTDQQLAEIMPNLSDDKRSMYLPFLNKAMDIYHINNDLRTAAFLAQIAHESGEFQYMEEIWGPTEAQMKYEPTTDVSENLGNTEPGDGALFKGRGVIQITGRYNYGKYGDMLGIDLISSPTIASTPQIAFSTAGAYWESHGLNELADQEDFETITKKINGGLNGYEDRCKYYDRAKDVLGV